MTDGRDAALIQCFPGNPDLPRGIAELGKKRHIFRNNEERNSARGQSSYSSWFLVRASGILSNSLAEFLQEAGARRKGGNVSTYIIGRLQARKRVELGMKIGMGSEGAERGRWAG